MTWRLRRAAVSVACAVAVVTSRPVGAQAAPARPSPASGAVAVDTSGVPFPFARFVDLVLAHHPVARQAELVAAQARAELRQAWGAFDPKMRLSLDQKRFGGTEYYNYVDAELKIPLPIGADITIAYDRTLGRYFNPDRRTAANGTMSAGISLPLGQRIVTDERRTALQQAQAARAAGDAERVGFLNKLLYSAAKDYGRWYEAWRRRNIALEGEALADFRLRAVRQRVANGESAPIDTVEALLELQRRQVTRLEADAGFFVASLVVTAYLWDERGAPVPLPPDARPAREGLDASTVGAVPLDELLRRAVQRNPDLQKVQAKVRQAEADRLLAAQGIIPFAEAKLAGLEERGADASFFDRPRLEANYKASLLVQSPLLFLKESGKLQSTGAKLDIQRLEVDRMRREVEVDVRASMFELQTLTQLLERQTATVRGASLLRDAEQVRFENGESTLLVLNLRERLVLDESVKLAALEGKLAAARAALAVAVGDGGLFIAR